MTDLIDFIRSYRQPVSIYEAAAELETLGKVGTGWTRATATHWHRELMRCVEAGELVLDKDMLSVAKKQSIQQGSLFEF